jgi:glycosyltransferase involved in cell wall biosynthesis
MISVVIPIYNGIEFIHESVGSVINQTYNNWELLIGINGHSENSEIYQRAKQYESDKIRVFDFYTIKGKSNTLNEIIQHCKYDYVSILDVDDIWHPEKLHIQSKYLHYDVVGSQCMYFGDRTGYPTIPFGDISSFDFFSVNPVINSSSIIRKELCHWNKEWDSVEDYDLWLTLRKKNKTFFNCKEPLVKHRIHSVSAFNSKGNHNKVPDLLLKHR